MNESINIIRPTYCLCCWRPITEKAKRGGLETYCRLHKPSGKSKSEYMRARRMLDKWVSQYQDALTKSDMRIKQAANLDELTSTLVADPKQLTLTEIRAAKGLIQELLKTTRLYYPVSFKRLGSLGEHINQLNLSIHKVLLATHFALGTKNITQAESEISAYDTKKESKIWFTQLLFTIARFEALSIITEQSLSRSVRKDKNQKLRSDIEKELKIAKINNKKLNQTAIARNLNLSKQRVGQLVKELYGNK
ncbi:hypothetical protein [Glaciecola punicea]|uniref:hypothetical protein n=1 Tax=Glaciecola punicea TaxID=56804 RepID=UPI00114CBA32|nr:hypothetical protein [Glaciecola punicea]